MAESVAQVSPEIQPGKLALSRKHTQGIQQYSQGNFAEALALLDQALNECIPAELWNDWGAAQLACGQTGAAEEGFRRAVNGPSGKQTDAAANLGLLLASQGRVAEAIPLLEHAAGSAVPEHNAALLNVLASCRATAATELVDATLREIRSELHPTFASASTPKLAAVRLGVPSRLKKRATDGCLVYKPDFANVPVHAAKLSGGPWEVCADHVVGQVEGASLRWNGIAGTVYVLLLHFPWGGRVLVRVNGVPREVIDTYSHGTYIEPVAIIRSSITARLEVELTVEGKNPLSQGAQVVCYGFLVSSESESAPLRRVETEQGFLAVQKQQVVRWIESIKNRGLTLEDVTRQRRGAYTIRVAEAAAFFPSRARILDIGCGYVFEEILRDVILSRGLEYWQQDIDSAVCDANVALFRRHGLPPEQIFCGDNTNLPYPDGHFQGVFSSHCLEHSRDLGLTFGGLRRILAPGGTLVFAVPRGWDLAEEHLYAPTQGGWEALCGRHGFQVISSNLGCYYPENGEYDLMIAAIRK